MTAETSSKEKRKNRSKKNASFGAESETMNREHKTKQNLEPEAEKNEAKTPEKAMNHHAEHGAKKVEPSAKPVKQETDSAKEADQSLDEKIDKIADDIKRATEKSAGATVTIAKKELDDLRVDLDEAKDRGLRALAELENFRQRKNRELAEDRKYASLDLARDILPVWDNMGRAIEAAEKDSAHDGKALIDGVKMMSQQFLDILRRHHIERIEAIGKPFDPNFHESIAVLPSDQPAGTVIVDSLPGFILHQRVVRPTQVVVAAAAPKSESENGK